MKINATITTDGKGYWSDRIATVPIVNLQVPYVNVENTFGELRVFFNNDVWNVEADGLIYSDSHAMHELKLFLSSIGLDGDDISYSEQGMQGYNYISCDVGQKFLVSWYEKEEEA